VEESQFHAILLQNIQEGIIATDLQGRITYWNNGAESIFGYSAEEMIGSSPALLYPDQDFSELSADLAQIAEGTDYAGEWQGRRKDGSEVWVDITTTVICDASGAAIGYVGTSRDVTERKQLEREVSRLFQREQRAHNQLRRFLALIAHELRQPLTVLRGSIQRLLQRPPEQQDADSAEHYLRLIDDASTRMQRFVEDVQDAARIGVSQFTVQPAEMDLVSALRLVVVEQTQTSSHRLVLNSPEELQGRWDRDRMIQLFTNLVSNAMNYSPHGSEVRIHVEQHDDGIITRVSDDGPGITHDDQATLFQPFTRLDENTLGTGLGLYICRGIVEAHGGRIWVESEQGKGSDFVIKLPVLAPSGLGNGDTTDAA
jgi:phosphoserine phosphatase RsbU/P